MNIIRVVLLAPCVIFAAGLFGCAGAQITEDGSWAVVGEVSAKVESEVGAKSLSIVVASGRTARSATNEPLTLRSIRTVNDATVTVRDEVTPVGAKAGGAPTDGQEVSLRLDSGDDLKITRAVDFKEKAVSVFSPPLIAMPGALKQGKPVVSSCKIVIHPVGDEKTVKHSGTARQEVTLLGTQRIRTPAGEFDAIVVKTVFTADLGMPKVKNETMTWFVPGKGIAIERESQSVTAVGLVMRSQTRQFVTESFDEAK